MVGAVRTICKRPGPDRCFGPRAQNFAGARGTLIRDRVEYALPLGPFGELAHAVFVRGQLEKIFDYRRSVIETIDLRGMAAAGVDARSS
jgi:hypothetical protein